MSHPEPLTMRNTHVSVIDDSIEVLTLLRELLQEEHYTVTTTTLAPGSWDHIAALQPDLLMLDLAVGNRLGWDLLERLQREPLTWDIPAIVFSTDPPLLHRAERRADRYAGRRFFLKPFDIDDLMTAVDELVESAEPDEPSADRAAAQ